MSERTLDLLDEKNETIESLKRDLRAAQELLFAVLDVVGKPVTFDIEDIKAQLADDRFIQADLNADEGTWTVWIDTVG